ncbi:MAG: hypothetical protein KDM64_18950, partial [Verrucomicrobiae bacterium]|nr:hypothetical protein [Verrucomicrobiae bacterium]
MRDLSGGFHDQQAMLRRGRKNAPTAGLANEVIMIVPGLVAEQGQSEVVLATRFSVAASSVAPVFGEYGNDFVGEIDLSFLVEFLNRDLNFGRVAD